jgi:hypothetical protein
MGRTRARWIAPPFTEEVRETISERVPIDWHFEFVRGKCAGQDVEAVAVLTSIADGGFLAYAHNEVEVVEVVEMLMAKKKRSPEKRQSRRAPRFKSMAQWYKARGFGLPMAYLADVYKDEFDPAFCRKDTFEAECCNPHCDGVIVHRHAVPWCWVCSDEVPSTWRRWFFTVWLTKRKSAAKALQRLIEEVWG